MEKTDWALNAAGVVRRYGSQTVLENFSLAVGAGRFEALMGPSGCGKSTFLHLAAGLISADGGSIEIGGASVTKMSDGAATRFRRRHVGVVFQAFNLLNEKTVEENILLPIRLDGRPVGPMRARLNELAEKLSLQPLLGKRPAELSGGERQRVAIARALLVEPDIVLADEPTGNLDARAAKSICELFKTVNEREKSAILVVTHDPQVAAAATRVHFLKDGRLAASHETQGDAARVSKLYLETYA